MGRIFTWTLEELDEQANHVKEAIYADLVENGIITEAQYEKLCKTKIVIVKPLGAISQFFRKLLQRKNLADVPKVIVTTVPWLENLDKDMEGRCLN